MCGKWRLLMLVGGSAGVTGALAGSVLITEVETGWSRQCSLHSLSINPDGSGAMQVAACDDANVETGAISGRVIADTDGDGVYESGVKDVALSLKDSAGNAVDADPAMEGVQPRTAMSAANGGYAFSGLAPGNYSVLLGTLPVGYESLSDRDGGAPNRIEAIQVDAGGLTEGQDFMLKTLATGPQDPGFGSGKWTPPGQPKVFVYDILHQRSYVPGCINGENGYYSNCGYQGSAKQGEIYSGRLDLRTTKDQFLTITYAERQETFSGFEGAVSLTYGDTATPIGGQTACVLSTRAKTVAVLSEDDPANLGNTDPRACRVPAGVKTVYISITPAGSQAGKCGLAGGEICRYLITTYK